MTPLALGRVLCARTACVSTCAGLPSHAPHGASSSGGGLAATCSAALQTAGAAHS